MCRVPHKKLCKVPRDTFCRHQQDTKYLCAVFRIHGIKDQMYFDAKVLAQQPHAGVVLAQQPHAGVVGWCAMVLGKLPVPGRLEYGKGLLRLQ